MKYFIDTEFIEGFHKHKGRQRHHVDPISVGVYCEDGRELHLISKEYDSSEAGSWVKENVFVPLYTQTVHGDARNRYTAFDFHKDYGLSHYQIRDKLTEFFNEGQPCSTEVYGYYSDYDWVAFCQFWGTMISLPSKFPMYCIDLKQILDEKGTHLKNHPDYPKQENEHNALADAKWNFELYQFLQRIVSNSKSLELV